MKFNISNFLLAILLATTAHAQSLSGSDLDGDGNADFVLVQIASSQALNWSSYSALGAAISLPLSELGKVGDHLAIANWASTTKSSLAYLGVHENLVRWYAVSDTGVVSVRSLGKKTDTFLAGGDFNSNKLAEAVAVRDNGANASLTWVVANDFFRHLNGAKKINKSNKYRYGTSGDLVFFANVNGKEDSIGVMRANPTGHGVAIQLKNLKSGKERKFKVTSYTMGTIRPIPIRQADGKDILALVQRQADSTVLKFVNLRGQALGSVELPGDGELVVGNFMVDQGQEIAIQTDDGFLIVNPITSQQTSVAIPAGIVADDVNVNSFSADEPVGTCEDQTLDPTDGPDGFLWKAQSIHGKLVILYPKEWTGSMADAWLETADGQFIERASSLKHLDPKTHPNARTFARYSKHGRRYPVNVKAVARLKQGCLKVYQITNPAVRWD